MNEGKKDFTFLIYETINEEFQRSFGRPFKLRTLQRHPLVKRWMQENCPDEEKFRRQVREVVTRSAKYSLEEDEEAIARANAYPEIKDRKSLLQTIEKTDRGLFVDDEVLKFTYKDVLVDLRQLLSEGRIKKIDHASEDHKFFVFHTRTEHEHKLRSDTHSEYGLKFYLDVCKVFIMDVEDSVASKDVKPNPVRDVATSDINAKLPGFLARKEEWLNRNRK